MSIESKHIPVPELYGNFWINSEPVSVYDHLGEVILIDFWDYSNIHCVRTMPYIQHWQYKYKEFGLIVVGVHTPEFEFARSLEYVQKAAEHFNITYPVMLDNDGLIWNAFGARSLPTRVLIDRDGLIRFIDHGGTAFEIGRAHV
jgi:thiol-disulfide isomerase/thioredoxin